MSEETDQLVREFYEDQALSEDTLAKLAAMADPEPVVRPARRWTRWVGVLGVAASLALVGLAGTSFLLLGSRSVQMSPDRNAVYDGRDGWADPSGRPQAVRDSERVASPLLDKLEQRGEGQAGQVTAVVTTPAIADPIPRERDYGTNPVVSTAEDALSTFAIDVDTASYARARQALRDGHLPSPASIRVEEFINYLPYEYVRPETGSPFAVDMEAVPSPWNPDKHLVRLGVQGRTVTGERKPVHLTFLVDTSGSMSHYSKIDLLKKSLSMLTEELEDGDTIAIVTYAGTTSVVLEPTAVAHRARILKSLAKLDSGGSTAMGAGIDLAYAQADAAFSEGSVNRVILCSDGDANVGITNPDALSRRIEGYADKGITLTTLGFGTGSYNDTTMERLANQGDGNYFFIDSERQARRVLVDQLTGTLEVIAKDVKIQVAWDERAVRDWRLVGYENRHLEHEQFRDDAVDAGEIGSGHRVTALYEVTLSSPGSDLGTVRVRSKGPGAESPSVERAYAMRAERIAGSLTQASANTQMASVMAGFAEKLRGNDVITWADLLSQAKTAQRAEYDEDAELVALIERAQALSQGR